MEKKTHSYFLFTKNFVFISHFSDVYPIFSREQCWVKGYKFWSSFLHLTDTSCSVQMFVLQPVSSAVSDVSGDPEWWCRMRQCERARVPVLDICLLLLSGVDSSSSCSHLKFEYTSSGRRRWVGASQSAWYGCVCRRGHMNAKVAYLSFVLGGGKFSFSLPPQDLMYKDCL